MKAFSCRRWSAQKPSSCSSWSERLVAVGRVGDVDPADAHQRLGHERAHRLVDAGVEIEPRRSGARQRRCGEGVTVAAKRAGFMTAVRGRCGEGRDVRQCCRRGGRRSIARRSHRAAGPPARRHGRFGATSVALPRPAAAHSAAWAACSPVPGGGLAARLQHQLVEDVGDVALDGVRAEVERAGDQLVAVAGGDVAQHLELARAERRRRGGGRCGRARAAASRPPGGRGGAGRRRRRQQRRPAAQRGDRRGRQPPLPVGVGQGAQVRRAEHRAAPAPGWPSRAVAAKHLLDRRRRVGDASEVEEHEREAQPHLGRLAVDAERIGVGEGLGVGGDRLVGAAVVRGEAGESLRRGGWRERGASSRSAAADRRAPAANKARADSTSPSRSAMRTRCRQ